MQRRTGLTLIEVLVAIFIMGIGLIALLTLFPIGILRMAQAIRDEKAAQAAGAAHAISKLYNFRNDSVVFSTATEPDLFSNPFAAGLLSADPFAESYAVYVDPIGFYSGYGDWVGGNANAGFLRRRPVAAVANLNTTIQTFKLWDDITFDSVFDPTIPALGPGTPKIIAPTTPPTIQRDPTYSWAYLLRRPQTQDRSVVDCAIVVYDKRPTVVAGETVFQGLAYFDPLRNTILVDITPGPGVVPPNIRPGDWIYDSTHYRTSRENRNPANWPNGSHSYFYRVVAAEDVPGTVPGKLFAKYEVQTPIRGFISGPSQGSNIPSGQDPTRVAATDPATVFQGSVIVMDRVVEVFEKGPVRSPK